MKELNEDELKEVAGGFHDDEPIYPDDGDHEPDEFEWSTLC